MTSSRKVFVSLFWDYFNICTSNKSESHRSESVMCFYSQAVHQWFYRFNVHLCFFPLKSTIIGYSDYMKKKPTLGTVYNILICNTLNNKNPCKHYKISTCVIRGETWSCWQEEEKKTHLQLSVRGEPRSTAPQSPPCSEMLLSPPVTAAFTHLFID